MPYPYEDQCMLSGQLDQAKITDLFLWHKTYLGIYSYYILQKAKENRRGENNE